MRRTLLTLAAGATAAVVAACGVPVPAGCEQRNLGTADEIAADTTRDWWCQDFGLPPGGIAGGATWRDGDPVAGQVQAFSVDCTGPGHVYGIYVDGAPANPTPEQCVIREYNA